MVQSLRLQKCTSIQGNARRAARAICIPAEGQRANCTNGTVGGCRRWTDGHRFAV